MSRMARLLAVWVIASAVVSSQSRDNMFQDFPTRDTSLQSRLSEGLLAKRIARLIATQPAAPETIELLLERNRLDDALNSVRVATQDPKTTLVPVLEVMAERAYRFIRDEGKGYGPRLQAILSSVRPAVGSLPREDAARAAKALIAIDNQLAGGGSVGWQQQMSRFVETYAGTEVAELTAVDLLSGGNGPITNRIAQLDEYWKAHPNSASGGRALFQKGFQLHVNVAITGVEPRGSDPTNRLLEVAAIVKELESGRYPAGQWVTAAPSLITGFFVSSSPPPAYGPGNVERSLEVYREFVLSHFDREPRKSLNNSVGYVITSKMAALYARIGQERTGIETLLKELESRSSNPAEVRLFRAQYYLQQSYTVKLDEQEVMARRAKDLLAALAAEKAGSTSRAALAELASFEFDRRDKEAAARLRSFIGQYPESSWSWVAGIKLGQLLEESGDLAAAEAGYLRAASGDPIAFARVVAMVRAAQTREGLGQFDKALDAYRLALSSWDTDYGIEYAWDTRYFESPQRPMASRRETITRELLTDRESALERALGKPGGAAMSRAAWLHRERRIAEARAAAEDVLRTFPNSPLAPDARKLLHEVQFDQALESAAVTNPARSEDAAMQLLDALAEAPLDAGVFAGRVAKSALLFRQGHTDAARELLRATLRGLIDLQRSQRELPLTGIDADVAAIRTVVFRPLGDLQVYRGQGWNAFAFPATLPEFVVISSSVTVTVPNAGSSVRTIRHPLPDLPNAVYLDRTDYARLDRIVAGIGGTERRAQAQIMETPNQPIGMSRNLVEFWNTLFPARPGHWGGWELGTYPQVTRIEFLDDARTRATAAVTIGYSGGVVVLEKTNGKWVAVRWTGSWIT